MWILVADALLAAVLFAAVWWLAVRMRNYGLLDVVWTLSIGLFALLDGLVAGGAPSRRFAFTAVALLWSLRLGLFILRRVLRHHPVEDKRYRLLRERWDFPLGFLVFFELQAAIALLFSLPFLAAAMNPAAHLGASELIGLALACVGIVGESVADLQAERFKRRPDRAARILDSGLWRYSRHPNYFFESMFWAGVCIASLASAYGWVSVLVLALMLYFLFRVTGIPLTEKHSLETHGAAYRRYQETTSAFIPWFTSR